MTDLRTTSVYTPDPTLEARDLHVHYRYDVSNVKRLRSLFSAERRTDNIVHAVRGLSLTARRGEAIGLIGRNGAGKSTLLRALAGLQPVTAGTIRAVSQPIRLGVGAALQRELPARDNIILGGLAMGMTRPEIVERIDEVLAFAGIGDAAERPLATYSTGMRSRILFAITTTVRPEILMVDEALAVGDAAFKRRSRARLREMVDQAGTVFVVSHNPQDISRLCTRGIWLEQGEVVEEGAVGSVLEHYRAFMRDRH